MAPVEEATLRDEPLLPVDDGAGELVAEEPVTLAELLPLAELAPLTLAATALAGASGGPETAALMSVMSIGTLRPVPSVTTSEPALTWLLLRPMT